MSADSPKSMCGTGARILANKAALGRRDNAARIRRGTYTRHGLAPPAAMFRSYDDIEYSCLKYGCVSLASIK